MPQQLRLFDFLIEERSPESLVISDANRDAWRMLQRAPMWPGAALALTGPRHSGRTHMASAWAQMQRGAFAHRDAPLTQQFRAAHARLVIDDADRWGDDGGLARVIDVARAEGGALLLIGESAPAFWPVGITDLRSRLAALAHVSLGEPDDALLSAVLQRHCRARFIKLTDQAAQYLVQHMERSFTAALKIAEALESAHVRASRPVSTIIAARVLRSLYAGAPDPDLDPHAFAEEDA
jgi:chromosomal replication initiation ATPase DnaA